MSLSASSSLYIRCAFVFVSLLDEDLKKKRNDGLTVTTSDEMFQGKALSIRAIDHFFYYVFLLESKVLAKELYSRRTN